MSQAGMRWLEKFSVHISLLLDFNYHQQIFIFFLNVANNLLSRNGRVTATTVTTLVDIGQLSDVTISEGRLLKTLPGQLWIEVERK